MKNLIYAAALSIFICFAVTAYSDGISSDLENNLIRLHIIANSDSGEDQNIKLAVRDAVVNELDCSELSPDEAAARAAHIAERVLTENNFSYGARGEFCTMTFPEREYKELTLPAGNYKAVRIILGEGRGHNWWCVLYPPVCMADVNGESMSPEACRILKESLDSETYELITGNKKINIKFRSVEIILKLKDILTNNI